eukprot:TRINITY_DN76567_c0_g1_i1.p1 TRINITY_DN76567_c0_g1~~TRINITY_DN76567_c0_g1_i1.p1  ORF type:complete len:463 (-),score=71.69 TRINITY_DN76567_c0_g1_i1:106-1437(-)
MTAGGEDGSDGRPASQAGRPMIFAGTSLSGVRVEVENLHGATRAAALAAAQRIQSAATLGDLDAGLRAAAKDLGGASSIEVSPASGEAVTVSLRQCDGRHLSVDAGLSPCLSKSGVAVRCEDVSSGRRLIGGLLSLGYDAAGASLLLSPWRLAGLGLTPTLEFAAKTAERSIPSRPSQTAHSVALLLPSPSGRHSLRLQAENREVVPPLQATNDVLKNLMPLRTIKTSLGYQYCDDRRPGAEGGRGEVRHLSAEVAGGAGDVALTRVHGLWTVMQHSADGAGFQVSASVAAARSLGGEGGQLPLEERFFLGGARGAPGERLPGFEQRCVAASGDVAPSPGQVSSAHLGGEARVSLTAEGMWPIPRCGGLQLRAFGGCGSLVSKASENIVQDLANQARASVGVSVGLPLPNGGFFGLSYAKPLLAWKGDRLEPLQLSLSFTTPC